MTIETNPDGSTKRIFAQLSDLNGFAVVDFAKRKEVARVELPKPAHATSRWTRGRNSAPSHGIGVTPDGKTLWVTSIPQQRGVRLFARRSEDGRRGRAAGAQDAGPRARSRAVANWVTFTPDGKTIYISNAGMRSVTAIDTAAMKVKAVIPVGEVPKRINTLVIRDGSQR